MPEVTKTLSGYEFNWAEDKLAIDVRRLRLHSDGRLTADIGIKLGKNGQKEPTFSFNFSSANTRKQLVKQLDEKYPEWTWLPIVDELARQVQDLATKGEDSHIIKPTTSDVKHPGYYIESVIVKGVPNVIYGDKGVNKTTLALMMLGIVAVDDRDSSTGLSAQSAGRVGILDWENNRDLTDYTLSRLVMGETIPYFELPYLSCTLPLADDMERIGQFIVENKIDLLLIDSLGEAAGSERFDSAGKGSALRIFAALRSFPGLTTLIIGQNAKDDTGKKTIYGSTYFTYYARNIWRIQAAKDQTGDDKRIALIHEESNFSRKSEPIGFNLSFTDDSITIIPAVVSVSQIYERANQTKTILDFLKSGAKTVMAIATEIDSSRNGTQSLLSKLKTRELVINIGAGMWALPYEGEEEA